MRLLLYVIDEVRSAVGPGFPVALKLNATDQLLGGFDEEESLEVISALDQTSVDLIDISGGTYFPGAKSASDSAGSGPYFLEFARRARPLTKKPLMLTGGFKTRQQAVTALTEGSVDMIGLARALVLDPSLPVGWQAASPRDPDFPRFVSPPEGGITAWYTMRLTEIGEDRETAGLPDLDTAIREYEARDTSRIAAWKSRFPL